MIVLGILCLTETQNSRQDTLLNFQRKVNNALDEYSEQFPDVTVQWLQSSCGEFPHTILTAIFQSSEGHLKEIIDKGYRVENRLEE